MDNKKSYKDYKYVYTGHKDYCKDHKIETEKKISTSTKEDIVHDHRYKFDFNNPTQHTHDYSFDFNNPNEHHHDYSFDFSQNPQPKNITANKTTNYTNTYNTNRAVKSTEAKPMATTARSTSTAARTTTSYSRNGYSTTSSTTTKYPSSTTTTRYTTSTYKKPNNNNQAAKAVKIFFFIFFIFPFIMTFLSIFFTAFDTDYETNNDYDTNVNYEDIDSDYYYYDQYTIATSSFCNAIGSSNFEYMRDRVTYEELDENDGIYWKNIINSYSPQSMIAGCTPYINKDLTISERNDLENEFYYEYYERIELTEAKQITITVKYYDQTGAFRTKYHDVYLGRINNKWFFINTI